LAKIEQVLDKHRKNWIGHVLRGESLLWVGSLWREEWKRPRGRPRMKNLWMD